MGSVLGIQKIAAKRIGITHEEYLKKNEDEKWCTSCKSWHSRFLFNSDNSRGDRLSAKCKTCTRVKIKKCWKGRVSTFKGKRHSEETKTLISNQKKGGESPMKGRHHSIETRNKISTILRKVAHKGEKCRSYKDGKVNERRGQRFSRDYKRWRFDVFSRDKFTCQNCGDNKGGNLNAHHIKHFADNQELRFEISNGVTLCEKCHKKEHRSS